MNVAVKVLAFGGALSGTALAINYAFGGETIENYLKNSKEYKNRVFLNSSTDGLDDIVKAYENSTRIKPKGTSNKNLDKAGLVKWCNDAIKGKYHGANDNSFKTVVSWCYININAFEKELSVSGKTKITEKVSKNKDWVDAWKKYLAERDVSSLKIKGHKNDAHLNGTKETEGQEALMNWCEETSKIKMYADDAKGKFDKFAHWCTKASVA